MTGVPEPWYTVSDIDDIATPALLVYPDRVEANVRTMIRIAGGPQRLRPHVKTHKLAELVRLQQRLGIDRFKCATIAEAEMVARCGAGHVLLAYPAVGPNARRLVELIRAFPATTFAAIADHPDTLRAISQAARERGTTVEVLLDLDCGMHRTGIAPGPEAVALYASLSVLPGLVPGGLHAYDGHIVDRNPDVRTAAARAAMDPVRALRSQLIAMKFPVPRLVTGGTPTLLAHAQVGDVECSPGTCVLWDAGYAAAFPDLDFIPAALVATRVVSKPGATQLCLDLGHKAVASEMPPPRVRLLELSDAVAVMHNEEHLVVETPRAAEFGIGNVLYGIPWHICPTVALHAYAVAVRSGRAEARWEIAARNRTLTI